MRHTHALAIPALAFALIAPTVAANGQAKVTTAGGNVILYTQKNVIDHMTVGDSLELEIAKLAASKAVVPAVKEFANMLVTEHTKHLENLRKLAAESDVGREANPADSTAINAQKVLTQLQSAAADSGFDRAFIQSQVEHHQKEIAWLKQVLPAAEDDDVEEDIKKTLPILEVHLTQAMAIAAQLNKPADSTIKRDSVRKTVRKGMAFRR
jgi:putative membrane protein